MDIVIVHYGSGAHLRRCLEAIFHDASKGSAEEADVSENSSSAICSVTIVDNASPEPVPSRVAELRGIRVIRSPTNRGFAAGANRGAREGEAPLVLFLNPDVEVAEAVLRVLSTSFHDPGVGAAAPLLQLPNGRSQVGTAGYLPTPGSVLAHLLQPPGRLPGPAGDWAQRPMFLRPSQLDALAKRPTGTPVEMEWVSGACLLVRREAFRRLGGFDERFFLYGEDMDLCHRLAVAGWRVLLHPGISAVHRHLEENAGDAEVLRAGDAEWIDGLDTYYRLHANRWRRFLHAASAVGFGARALAYHLGLLQPHSPAGNATRRLRAYAQRAAAHAVSR